jgi:hypothetical protein
MVSPQAEDGDDLQILIEEPETVNRSGSHGFDSQTFTIEMYLMKLSRPWNRKDYIDLRDI